ncbi:NUDIX hydrolase [Fulvivirga sediminis]|uniref:CoA pyrophosphatase n=1 Tax=Fulvivirga sediminis TaxID=2803949 RepID=A0A937F7C6_9BACT|nr:CoA pyrophosphatase [Fulvivirga sediminis]MBL3655964.1 CoA pyrophosphatase [Fulvivirga sediminis]
MHLKNNEFKEFIDKLQNRLKSPLPGANAQRIMMPAESTEERFNLDKKDVRLGGVMVLFYEKEDGIYLPLTQRHDYKGTHGGQVSLPGGKWEEEDENLEATALRETHEEIGISPDDVTVIGKLSDLYIPPSNFRVSPFIGYTSRKPNFNIDTYEVKELLETPVNVLEDKAYRKQKDILVRSHLRLKAPYFDVNGKVVWGATAMMLAELVSLIDEIRGISDN